jgi:hypothetical protein
MARTSYPRTMGPRSPLAGQRFESEMSYMNARARHLGFSSYAGERAAKLNPNFVVVQQRARSVGRSRADAIRIAREVIGNSRVLKGRREAYPPGAHPQGAEMSRVIELLGNRTGDYADLYDNGQAAADDIYYE